MVLPRVLVPHRVHVAQGGVLILILRFGVIIIVFGVGQGGAGKGSFTKEIRRINNGAESLSRKLYISSKSVKKHGMVAWSSSNYIFIVIRTTEIPHRSYSETLKLWTKVENIYRSSTFI